MDRELYQRAECFLPWNLKNNVFNSTIFPYWLDEAIYYFQESATSKSLFRIDIQTGKKETVLDYQRLIDALSDQLKHAIDPAQLPLDGFSIQENPQRLCFTYEKNHWSYNLEKHGCMQEADINPGHLESPDKNWALGKKDYDLVLTNLIAHQDFQLTMDGEHYYDYGSSPETNTQAITQRLKETTLAPIALWSPDSHKIITHKLDQRKVDELFLLQNAPEGSQRPKLHSYRMSFSGDANLPLAELIVIDVLTKTVVPLKTEPFLSPYLTPLEFKWVWWSEDSKKIYFLRETRGSKELMLCVAEANTGVTQTLITENAETYIEPNQHFPCPHQVLNLEDSKKIVWLSERSGHSHLYLYNMGNNVAKQAITQGEWCVREVLFYDDKTDWLYFTACGYDKKIDPYYKQLFRCRLDGSELQCLTEEHANHTIYFSPRKNCFLDTYSTINTTPISVLKTIDGKLHSQIEIADIQGLLKLNCDLAPLQ